MKRKLFSTMLCAFALLLLMGAAGPQPTIVYVTEEESTSISQEEQVLETGDPTGTEESGNAQPQEGEEQSTEETVESEETTEEAADSEEAADEEENTEETLTGEEPEEEGAVEAAPALDYTFLIDGQPAQLATSRVLVDGVTYVAMGPAVKDLDPTAQVTWDGSSRTVTVQTANLTLTAKVGQPYAVANGRYLYAQDGIQMQGDRVMIPLRILTEAFDAKLSWDKGTDTIYVQRGSGALMSGDQFYNQEDLFWLSRVIYAESGNQTLKGQMAVANVVLNRVNSPLFPDSVLGVLSQRNQFTTYRGGKLANRTPSESSVIAAKLVMDGGVVEESEGALFFDSLVRSWASRNKTYVCTIGGHKFYR